MKNIKCYLNYAVCGLLLVSLSGCGMLDFLNPEKKVENSEEDLLAAEDAESEGGIVSEEQKLFNTGPQPLIKTYRPFEAKMPDGTKLVGTLYIPGISPYEPPSKDADAEAEDEASDEEDSADKPKTVKPAKVHYPLVILLHMLSDDRWSWKETPRHLVSAGYAVLALDLRGHGDSSYKGKRLNVWREFDKPDWNKMPQDVVNAVQAISENPEFNMVSTQSVALMGASIGANVAANFAAKKPALTKALVLLSPGLEYHGIETLQPISHTHAPLYLAASQEDAYAADSTQQLYKMASGKKKIKIYENLGHGIDMLKANPDLEKDILTWLKSVMPPSQVVAQDMDSTETEAEKTDEKAKTTPTPTPTATAGKPKATPLISPTPGVTGDTKPSPSPTPKPKPKPTVTKKPEPTKAPEKPKVETKPIIDDMMPLAKPPVSVPEAPANPTPAN